MAWLTAKENRIFSRMLLVWGGCRWTSRVQVTAKPGAAFLFLFPESVEFFLYTLSRNFVLLPFFLNLRKNSTVSVSTCAKLSVALFLRHWQNLQQTFLSIFAVHNWGKSHAIVTKDELRCNCSAFRIENTRFLGWRELGFQNARWWGVHCRGVTQAGTSHHFWLNWKAFTVCFDQTIASKTKPAGEKRCFLGFEPAFVDSYLII